MKLYYIVYIDEEDSDLDDYCFVGAEDLLAAQIIFAANEVAEARAEFGQFLAPVIPPDEYCKPTSDIGSGAKIYEMVPPIKPGMLGWYTGEPPAEGGGGVFRGFIPK